MKRTLTFLTAMLLMFAVNAKTKVINITADDGAHIFVNGKEMGNSATVVIKNTGEVTYVRVEKIGFIPAYRQYSFLKSKKELPDNDYIKLEPDEAYNNSETADQINKDIELRTNLSEDEAWKLISRIITDYFDVIEVTDKTTGYLRTAWVVKKFNGGTIRTRIVIKTGSNNPLSYKVKLSSEFADVGKATNQDDSYTLYNRCLRGYEAIISEMQSRLSK